MVHLLTRRTPTIAAALAYISASIAVMLTPSHATLSVSIGPPTADLRFLSRRSVSLRVGV